MENQPKGKLRIYAAGGFGLNIASRFSEPNSDAPGYCTVEPAYIDSSRSNLSREGITEERLYLLPDVDGAGSIRTEVREDIIRNVPHILQKFKPLDFNLVVFSAGGGSGSVAGPYITRDLLARGLPTAVIVVGADESITSAKNTLATLKSLEGIAEKQNLPVVMYYRQNGAGIKRSEIDTDCHYVVAALSMLCSKQNAELDSKDIQNWVQFSKYSSARPRLARLMVSSTNASVDALEDPISIATLTANPDDEMFTTVPEYHCAGFPIHANLIRDALPRHLTITYEGIPDFYKKLSKRIDELALQNRGRVNHESLVSAEEVDDDGMVF